MFAYAHVDLLREENTVRWLKSSSNEHDGHPNKPEREINAHTESVHGLFTTT
jgi:hypothetical protein